MSDKTTDAETERRAPNETSNSTPMERGEAITCEAGHIIAIASETVTPGGSDEGWMAKMVWEQDPPQNGDPATCRICGRIWLLHYSWPTDHPPLMYRRSWICVEDKWSSPLTPAARKYLNEFTIRDET